MNLSVLKEKLSFQLMRSIFGLYLTLAILVTCFQIYLEFNNTKKTVENELDVISWTFNSSLTSALYDLDEELAKLILVGTTKNSIVVGGEILDEKDDNIHAVGMTQIDEGSNFSQRLIKIEKNIVMEREGESFHLGKLILYSNYSVIIDRIRYGLLLIAISSLIKTTILWIIMVYFLNFYLSRPLSVMTDKLKNLDLDHLRTIDNSPTGNKINEISKLKDSFNSLIMRLRQSNRELVNHKEHLEDTVKVRTRSLEKALKVKSQFMANVSHEVRTPLHAIMGMVEQLNETDVDYEQKEMLKIIKNASEGLLGIVNDILDFNSVETSQLKIKNSSTNLRELINNIVALYQSDCDRKGIQLKVKIGESFPEIVYTDAVRVKQILNNLVSNAIKFTNEGEIEITLNTRKKQNGNEIVLSVRDTGIGISQNNKIKLFDIFAQEDGSSTRRHGGIGIGLTIVSKLVHLMGGRVHFDSEKGSGTEFFVILPSIEKENIDEKKLDNDIPEDILETFNILLVEDNLVNQKLARKMLERIGLRFEIAENGQVAYEKTMKYGYTHVLMDIQMPVLDGISATKKIVEALGNDSPIILALTANAFEEDRMRCEDAGMSGFLTKPLNMKDLKTALYESYVKEKKKAS